MRVLPRRTLLLFPLVVATSSLLHAAEYKPATRGQPEKKFVVKPGGLLIFDADLAHGEIETGDFESVRVSFESYYKVDTAEEVEALYDKLSIETSQTENTVKVTVRFADENQANRDKVRLNFKVAIPRKFNLDFRTGGSATVNDVDGTVKASTLGGSLKVKNITGSLTASSKGGALTIGNVGGDLEARCVGGATTIGQVSGRVVSTTEGGSVWIKEATTGIDATVKDGSITAYLSKTPTSDCKITATAGTIELRLGESVAATIDAAWSSGGIMSDFKIASKEGKKDNSLKGDINGGGRLITLRTTAGSIHINK
jgi:putative adhesin